MKISIEVENPEELAEFLVKFGKMNYDVIRAYEEQMASILLKAGKVAITGQEKIEPEVPSGGYYQ